jgi:cytochrome c-type biogenesis protein CcmE
MKAKYIIGVGIILIFMVFAGMSLQKSMTPYVTISEAKLKGTTVQIKGIRISGSDMFDMEHKTFNFKIKDENGQEVQVIYNGVKPSNFDEAMEVVAKGRFQNDVFYANEILVKCPSKYEAETFNGSAKS